VRERWTADDQPRCEVCRVAWQVSKSRLANWAILRARDQSRPSVIEPFPDLCIAELRFDGPAYAHPLPPKTTPIAFRAIGVAEFYIASLECPDEPLCPSHVCCPERSRYNAIRELEIS